MTDHPRLSICIPTYNFGPYIGSMLASAVSQLAEGVEIVILDGGSTDETESVVRRYQESARDAIKYYRLPARGGIDVDLAKCVELAQGDYCWLFSADDVLRQGAIPRILHEIRAAHDLYICRHSDCTLDMKLLREHLVLSPNHDAVYALLDRMAALDYFRKAVTTEALFSFIGGLIVSRRLWCSVAINDKFVGSCWAHVARLLELLQGGISLKFISAVLSDRRGDNDSFADKGVVHRYSIAIDGYQRLARAFYGEDSEEAIQFKRVLAYEFDLRHFLSAKCACTLNPSTESLSKLNELIAGLYRNTGVGNQFRYFLYRIIPIGLYQGFRKMYRNIKRS
jgi:abequosyltransferase